MTLRRVAWMAGVPLIGLLLGVGIAIASSPTSLNPDGHKSTGVVLPSPEPSPSPSPTVNAPGQLGIGPRLITNGSNTVIGVGASLAAGSSDGGKTWIVIRPPAPGSSLAVDPSNPRHAIAGGSAIQITNDGGVTWTPARSAPPAAGSYQPLAISPAEPNVWFVAHQGKLFRTRDGSSSWTDVGGLRALSNPILVSGQALGQFFLAAGTQIFELNDYGTKVIPRASIAQGTVTDLAIAGGSSPAVLAKAGGLFVLQSTTWTSASADISGPIAGGADNTLLVGNGGGKLGSPGQVSYSVDLGKRWRQADGLPFDQTVEAIAGQPDSRVFFAYCFGGDVYTSNDGGRTWILVSRQLRGSSA